MVASNGNPNAQESEEVPHIQDQPRLQSEIFSEKTKK